LTRGRTCKSKEPEQLPAAAAQPISLVGLRRAVEVQDSLPTVLAIEKVVQVRNLRVC
jgi:hypothetical protein